MSRKNRRRDRYDSMFEDYDDYSDYGEVGSSDSPKKNEVWETPSPASNADVSTYKNASKEISEERDAWRSVLQQQKESEIPLQDSEGYATPDIVNEPNRFVLLLKQGCTATVRNCVRGGKWLFHQSGKRLLGSFHKLRQFGGWSWQTCRKIPRRYALIGMISVMVLGILGGGFWLWSGFAGKEVALSESEGKKEVSANPSPEKTVPTPVSEGSSQDIPETASEDNFLPSLDLSTSLNSEKTEDLTKNTLAETSDSENLPSGEESDLSGLATVPSTIPETTSTTPEMADSVDSLASLMDGLGISDETVSPEMSSLETNSPEMNSPETNSLETNSLETNSLETNSLETNSLETNPPRDDMESLIADTLPLAEKTVSPEELPETTTHPLPTNENLAEPLAVSPPTSTSEDAVLAQENLMPLEIPKSPRKNTLADSLATVPDADAEHILAPPGFAPEPSDTTKSDTTKLETPDPYLPNSLFSIPDSPSNVEDPFSGNLESLEENGKADNVASLPSLSSALEGAKEAVREESTDGAKEKKISNDTAYVVQDGDNYWNISEKVYGTGAYFRAIAQYNSIVAPNPNKLTAGMKLLIPNVSFLRSCYPALCPETGESVSDIGTPRHNDPIRVAYVIQEGDTLSDIARRQLGNASRWPEIYRLNRDVLNNRFDLLVPGVKLVLPPVENHVASESSLWK